MPTQLLFTRFLNHHFAHAANSLLGLFHVAPVNPRAPITNAVSMELLVFLILLVYLIAVRFSLNVEKPNGLQHLAEMLNEGVEEQSEAIIGHGFERFTSYLTVLFMFILLCNLVGLIPGLESPTANPSVPLGFAVVTFLYYHYHGIRVNKGSYIKQFLGPVWWLYWLLFPIEVISHFARILSLTVRLYANMFAGDLLTMAFFSLIPIGVPLVFLGLHLGVAVIQAYVFAVLGAIYLGLAVAHEH
jgi:F-type H+-transporting ATPase subunit a